MSGTVPENAGDLAFWLTWSFQRDAAADPTPPAPYTTGMVPAMARASRLNSA